MTGPHGEASCGHEGGQHNREDQEHHVAIDADAPEPCFYGFECHKSAFLADITAAVSHGENGRVRSRRLRLIIVKVRKKWLPEPWNKASLMVPVMLVIGALLTMATLSHWVVFPR